MCNKNFENKNVLFFFSDRIHSHIEKNTFILLPFNLPWEQFSTWQHLPLTKKKLRFHQLKYPQKNPIPSKWQIRQKRFKSVALKILKHSANYICIPEVLTYQKCNIFPS